MKVSLSVSLHVLIACVPSLPTLEFEASKYCTLRRYSDQQPFPQYQPGRVVLRRHLSQSGISRVLPQGPDPLTPGDINYLCFLRIMINIAQRHCSKIVMSAARQNTLWTLTLQIFDSMSFISHLSLFFSFI